MPLLIIRPRFFWAGLGFECNVAGEGERVTCMLYSETLVVIYVLNRTQIERDGVAPLVCRRVSTLARLALHTTQ